MTDVVVILDDDDGQIDATPSLVDVGKIVEARVDLTVDNETFIDLTEDNTDGSDGSSSNLPIKRKHAIEIDPDECSSPSGSGSPTDVHRKKSSPFESFGYKSYHHSPCLLRYTTSERVDNSQSVPLIKNEAKEAQRNGSGSVRQACDQSSDRSAQNEGCVKADVYQPDAVSSINKRAGDSQQCKNEAKQAQLHGSESPMQACDQCSDRRAQNEGCVKADLNQPEAVSSINKRVGDSQQRIAESDHKRGLFRRVDDELVDSALNSGEMHALAHVIHGYALRERERECPSPAFPSSP
jgi:hypothetical protein